MQRILSHMKDCQCFHTNSCQIPADVWVLQQFHSVNTTERTAFADRRNPVRRDADHAVIRYDRPLKKIC